MHFLKDRQITGIANDLDEEEKRKEKSEFIGH